MKKIGNGVLLIAMIGALLWGASCSGPQVTEHDKKVASWFASQGTLKVLCSIGMITDLVEQVGGEHVHTLSLITGELDPHTYEMVKGDGEKLALADLIFYNGLDLEHGPSLKRYLKESKKAFSMGDWVAQQAPEKIIYVEGAVDPHIWMDISLWALTVDRMATVLAEAAPEHRLAFEENAQKLKSKMDQAHGAVRALLQGVPDEKRFLVTSHDAFNYFSRAYLATEEEQESSQWNKRFQAPDGLAPDGQMSTTDIRQVLEHLEKYQIQVLFTESNVSRDVIDKVVESGNQIGLNIRVAHAALYGDAMGPEGSGADTHLNMIEHNAKVIVEHLQ